MHRLFLLSGGKICFKAGGKNFQMTKYGTLTQTRGYNQRIVGWKSDSF